MPESSAIPEDCPWRLLGVHSVWWGEMPDPANPAVPRGPGSKRHDPKVVFTSCETWLRIKEPSGRAVMVSDNPAFDFMWIADGFWRHLGRNPFGHSARRLSDFYAGLPGDFRSTQNGNA
jgi:hypothetical protein